MTTFSDEEVRRLAALARLELTGEEVDRFARQLGEILDFARQVNAVDLSASPEAAASSAAAGDTLRDDDVRPSLELEAVLEAAPDADREEGLFVVPRVLN